MYLRRPGLSRFSLARCLACGTDGTTKLKSNPLWATFFLTDSGQKKTAVKVSNVNHAIASP